MPSESVKNLDSLIEYLKPFLISRGFKYEPGQQGYSSGGQFANAFFRNEKIKIGLIFRQNEFGSVNYETDATNISHDMLLRALNKESKKNLFYDNDRFKSYTLNDEELHTAILMDWQEVVIPYIESTSIQDINSMMLKEKEKIWK